ncbi:MAG TPA: hypothetical protein V6C65_26200 [Allocoleopsis sp.]
MNYQPGQPIEWNPLDESPESYSLGYLLFGDQQHKIREIARKVGKTNGPLKVSKVCHETNTITFTAAD